MHVLIPYKAYKIISDMLEEPFKKCVAARCERGPIITDDMSGETVCQSCGLVFSEKSEYSGSDYPTYEPEDLARNRIGGKISLAMYDMGLPTIIDFKNKDALGRPLSSDMKSKFSRLRTWDVRSKATPSDKNLKSSFSLLNALKENLSIPDMVIERAAQIYRKAVTRKLTRGRSAASILCASLYSACRESDTPRTLIDIAMAANVRKKVLSRSYRILIESLDLRLKPYDSSEFINMIASKAMISEKTRRDALQMLSIITKNETVTGKNPLCIASSVLYLSCRVNGEKKTQGSIAKASGITSVTIRNTIPKFRKELGL